MFKKILKKILEFLLDRIGTVIFLLIVAVLLIVGVSKVKEAQSNAITFADDYEAPEATADLSADGEYRVVASNDVLDLLYNDVKGAIQVLDKRTNHLWKSIVDEEVFPDYKNNNKTWVFNMTSAVHITYNDLKKRDSGSKDLFAAKDCGFLEANPIENGIEVTYGFLKPGIYVTVDYTIDGENLVVNVPYEKIQELTKYALTTIAVLPYMGACQNNNEGYLFYPDGSGAVTTFERASERPANVLMAKYYTYSHRSMSFMDMDDPDNYDRYTAAFPVCGIKNGDDAVFAFATEGAENTAVVVYPYGCSINLNRTSFEIYVRNAYNVDMYSVSTGSGNKATGSSVTRVDKEIIKENKEIRYAFLSGDKANYSGMADVYRNYLIENDKLAQSDDVDNTALALRLLMGTTKPGILFDEYVKMTDFNQTIDIINSLKEKGIDAAKVVLAAWMKNYEDYSTWGPDGHLGGTAGLKKISDFAKQDNGYDIFLENNFMQASSNTKGIDEKKDVAYNGLNLEISVKDMDEVSYYFLNPVAVKTRHDKFLKKLSKYDGLGIAYGDIARYAYPDFNEWHKFLKSETAQALSNVLSTGAETGRKIATYGNNAYSLADTDYLYYLKEDTFGLAISDFAVPFAQLVVSGRMSYSSENAGNLCYDLQTQKLHWIEFGSMPYFYLTAESALNLRDTGHDLLFSSTFSEWEDILADTCNEFKKNLGCVAGKRMIEHTILTDDLRLVRYENGVSIYINYANTDSTVDEIVVPANNYVVTGGEG